MTGQTEEGHARDRSGAAVTGLRRLGIERDTLPRPREWPFIREGPHPVGSNDRSREKFWNFSGQTHRGR